jgi:hypothetical protein
MKFSIIDLLNKHGYQTEHLINNPLVNEIDELFVKNNCLRVTFVDKGKVILKKKMKFKYNISIQIINEPLFYSDEIIGYMATPINLSFIHEGIIKLLNRNEGKSNISEEKLKLMREERELQTKLDNESLRELVIREIEMMKNNKPQNNTHNSNNNISNNYISHINDFEESTDDDPFSERSIMRDLENGEGEKHGY